MEDVNQLVKKVHTTLERSTKVSFAYRYVYMYRSFVSYIVLIERYSSYAKKDKNLPHFVNVTFIHSPGSKERISLLMTLPRCVETITSFFTR